MLVRFGPLTQADLSAAIADETLRGRPPHSLIVGSEALRLSALRMLEMPDGLGAVVQSVPRVELEGELPSDGWALRTLAETAAALR